MWTVCNYLALIRVSEPGDLRGGSRNCRNGAGDEPAHVGVAQQRLMEGGKLLVTAPLSEATGTCLPAGTTWKLLSDKNSAQARTWPTLLAVCCGRASGVEGRRWEGSWLCYLSHVRGGKNKSDSPKHALPSCDFTILHIQHTCAARYTQSDSGRKT